jgi:hypothetical protein
MHDLPTLRHGRPLLWLLTVIVVGATLTGFAESYNGLYLWALSHGIHGGWARAWPIQVDAFVAAGELGLILAARYLWDLRMRALAWTVSGTGLAVSILCNAGHVGRATWTVHATAAVPPIAAMGGLLAILATLKQITHMGRRAPGFLVNPSGPALTDPAVMQLTPGPARLTPFTPAARAAYLAGATHDLIAMVSDVTRAVTTVERLTPGPERTPPRPLRSVTLAPVRLTPALASVVNPITVSLTPPAVPASLPPAPRAESVRSELTESGPGSDPAQRDLDQMHLEGLPSDADRVRFAIATLGLDTAPARLHEWLTERGHGAVARANVKSTLRRAREQAQRDQSVTPESETPVIRIIRGAR